MCDAGSGQFNCASSRPAGHARCWSRAAFSERGQHAIRWSPQAHEVKAAADMPTPERRYAIAANGRRYLTTSLQFAQPFRRAKDEGTLARLCASHSDNSCRHTRKSGKGVVLHVIREIERRALPCIRLRMP